MEKRGRMLYIDSDGENVIFQSFPTTVFTDGVNGEESLFLHIRTFHLKLQTVEQQTQIRP